MGIKDLSKVISDHAPLAVSEHDIKAFFGRKVAVDASMSIYQFLIAVRQGGAQLMSDDGDTTSHLLGLFYRTIRMCENGIKPVYVFDGKPPELKSDELAKRKERREEAAAMHQKAVEAGDQQAIDKFSRRLVKVTPEHNDECKRLLKLMGVPYVEAPCEAEAQCAELVRSGVAFAIATEDMDGLTFGANVLLRHLTFSEAKKMPIKQFKLDKVLEGMGLDMTQFVDLCILLGCDYCPSIRGIGQKKAFELIKQHKSIDAVLDHLDKAKYPPPEDWNYERARYLFNKPDVTSANDVELLWTDPDDQGLVDFLVSEKNFQEERVRSGAAKLLKCRHGATQGRIDAFFTVSAPVKTGALKSGAKKEEPKKRKAGGKGNPAKRPK